VTNALLPCSTFVAVFLYFRFYGSAHDHLLHDLLTAVVLTFAGVVLMILVALVINLIRGPVVLARAREREKEALAADNQELRTRAELAENKGRGLAIAQSALETVMGKLTPGAPFTVSISPHGAIDVSAQETPAVTGGAIGELQPALSPGREPLAVPPAPAPLPGVEIEK
jgi:hypothetical protein